MFINGCALKYMTHDTWRFDGVRVARLIGSPSGYFLLSSFCVLCSILPVYLDCPFPIALSVFSSIYLIFVGSEKDEIAVEYYDCIGIFYTTRM